MPGKRSGSLLTDRTMLESDPHRLVEGIAIASYAIGASSAIVFFRKESQYARKRLQKAIDSARDYGLLGHNIFSSGYNLDIVIRKEPGAFVCGEEATYGHARRKKRNAPDETAVSDHFGTVFKADSYK